MDQLLLHNARVIEEDGIRESGYVAVSDGKISRIGRGFPEQAAAREVIDCHGRYLSPGFIDIHTHGAGGCDFMDGETKDILTAARAHLKHGTTSVAPTTLTCSDEDLFRFFDCYREAKTVQEDMPCLLGIHLEGPYFSPAQAGAQPLEHMRFPAPEHYERILDYAGDDIIRWSSAPELDGSLKLGDELKKRGIMAAIGHTDAVLDQILQAVEHGYSHVTHLYSGMSALTRVEGMRVLGAVESAYLLDELTVEIIADGIHLPPELLRLILKCKSHDSICLVTDSMRGAGMPEGPSVLGSKKNGLQVVIEDGIAKMPDHSGFAGSVATADRLVRVMTQKAGLPLFEAVRMITRNPARFLGIDSCKGSIETGKDGDLILFDDDIHIEEVIVGGRRIHFQS